MLFGKDFDKIQVEVFGLTITEPNGFLTDTIMAVVSLILAYYVYRNKLSTPFLKYWFLFFLIYGISSFSGGLGHAFYSYWGVAGKFFNWISGIYAIYILELAMIKLVQPIEKRKLYEKLAFLKVSLVFIVFGTVCVTQPISENPSLAFLPIAFNTILGVILTVGVLGYHYSKLYHPDYKYFYYGVLIMVPSAAIFLGKINPHPWFDKNDLSHVLLTIGIIFFYIGINKTQYSVVKTT